ncbi:MAG: endonuclease domain-containing protein [Alphaproteobacteria bacterium]|nr:endonuclease domain-containing protein [Alphaproteobacteria bacterium]
MANKIARQLRQNQTRAEKALWRELRHLKSSGFHFRRQAPLGNYNADFACHAASLIIECDGGQHAHAAALEKDADRTIWLETQGYRVLRFWNNDVQ